MGWIPIFLNNHPVETSVTTHEPFPMGLGLFIVIVCFGLAYLIGKYYD